MGSSSRTVSVSVVLDDDVDAGCIARVVVEDTSRADAPAAVVAEVSRPLTRPMAAGDRVHVELIVPVVDTRAMYNVRAHIDRSGSGEVSEGDQITVQAYPVLTGGAADSVEVEVRTI